MFNKLLLGSFLLTTSVYCSNQASSSNLSLRASSGYNSDDAPLKFEDDGYANSAKLRHLIQALSSSDQLKKFCEQEERDGRKVDFVYMLRNEPHDTPLMCMESGIHTISDLLSTHPDAQSLEKMVFVFSRFSDDDLTMVSGYGRFGIVVSSLINRVILNYRQHSDLVNQAVCGIKRLLLLSNASILEHQSFTDSSSYGYSSGFIVNCLAKFARLGLVNKDACINDLIRTIMIRYPTAADGLKAVCPEVSNVMESSSFGSNVLNYELYKSIVGNDLKGVQGAIETGAKPECMIPLASTNSSISALQVAVLSRRSESPDLAAQLHRYYTTNRGMGPSPEFISLDIVYELLRRADAKVLTDFESSDLNFYDYTSLLQHRNIGISKDIPLILILFKSRIYSKSNQRTIINDANQLAQLLSMFLNRYAELGLRPRSTSQAIIELENNLYYKPVKGIVVSYKGKDMTVDQMIKEALS